MAQFVYKGHDIREHYENSYVFECTACRALTSIHTMELSKPTGKCHKCKRVFDIPKNIDMTKEYIQPVEPKRKRINRKKQREFYQELGVMGLFYHA